MRRIDGRRFNDSSQTCALRDGKIFCVNTKVCLCGGLNPVCAAPEVDRIQIHGQNLILAVCTFDLKSQIDFFELAPKCFFRA